MSIERSAAPADAGPTPQHRLVDGSLDDNSTEQAEEASLRPTSFADYIGQEHLKANLKLAIDAVKKRADGTVLDHVLLYGPPGLGKTTMAGVIAREMGANLRITSGPAIERAGDLASILTNLQNGDVLFIDEIHRLRRAVEEVLYSAMEDYKLDIIIGKGPAARSVRLDLPRFTVIGATTRTGSLAGPLRDRFGLIHRLEYYKIPEIERIIERTARLLGTTIAPEATALLATRSRLTPRIANRLTKRVRDYADVNGDGIIDVPIATAALQMMEIDELGLDPADRNMLRLMLEIGMADFIYMNRTDGQMEDLDRIVAEEVELNNEMATAVDIDEQYEIANFARAGRESRHNLNYWREGEYLGIGPGAASYINGARMKNSGLLREYAAALDAGRLPIRESERLDAEARGREAAVLALRTAAGIERAEFAREYGEAALARVERIMGGFPKNLYESDERGIRLTKSGMRVANLIWEELV